MRRWAQTVTTSDMVRSVNRPISQDDIPTLEQVSRNVFHALQRHFPDHDLETLLLKLTGYRLVDRVCDLHKGRYIRWIRLDGSPMLHKGAVAVNVVLHKVDCSVG